MGLVPSYNFGTSSNFSIFINAMIITNRTAIPSNQFFKKLLLLAKGALCLVLRIIA
jgi:hypothetical protein